MHVLVTTDGSARSLAALPHAAAFCRVAGADLTLLRVLDPFIDGSERFAATRAEAVEATAVAWQAETEGTLAKAGVHGEPLVVVKKPGEATRDAVLRVADDRASALIVMDSRGAGALRHALLGSVALGVVGGTQRAVMITGANIGRAWLGEHYPLLATTDGSPASRAVVSALTPLAASAKVDLTLLRMCWPEAPDLRACHQAELDALAAEFHTEGQTRTLLQEDAMVDGVATAILAAAREQSVAAIAMATHGESAAYHLFVGSTALAVLAHSPIPVILAGATKPRPPTCD